MAVRRCALARARVLGGFAGTRGWSVERFVKYLSTVVEYQQEAEAVKGSESDWKVIRRPLLEMELRNYAQLPVVPQPLILHGPRGVGKRTTVEGLLEEWNTSPHAVAYVDLYSPTGGAVEGKYIPPWTVSQSSSTLNGRSGDGTDLGWVRQKLEQGLESLAIQAVQTGCLKSKSVLDSLAAHHTIDGALLEILQTLAPGVGASGSSGETKQLWQNALLLMRRVLGSASQLSRGRESVSINQLLSEVLENGDAGPSHKILSDVNDKKNKKSVNAQSNVKEKALLSLALAKHLLKIQEDWRLAAGADQRKQGLIPKALVDAAVSWPVLLFALISWATEEGVFQPKLVINGLEVLRNASTVMGVVDGVSYHDGLLLQLLGSSLSQGSIPVILVSSDSYYSWRLGEDFGSTDAFISSEVFGWTPKEAAIHLVPGVFSADEWKVVAAVLGSNPRHLVELLHLWRSKTFTERVKDSDSVDIEDGIDLYLAYLQVTAVDPAMDAALGLLEQFADKAAKGLIDRQILQHGAPWRKFPKIDDKNRRHLWARIQLLDFVQAFTDTELGVNYLGRGLEILDDPAALALVQVGILYQQRAPPYLRSTSRGISRCLARWLVREKLNLGSLDKLRLRWHRLIRGRYYRHLMLE